MTIEWYAHKYIVDDACKEKNRLIGHVFADWWLKTTKTWSIVVFEGYFKLSGGLFWKKSRDF